LGSGSVRRVAAKVYAAAELDAEMRIAMMKQLTQMVTWQQMAAIAGWPFDDHIADSMDGEEGAIEIDWAVYSDGRPVFTVVDWLDGYATIVHHPDLLQPETEDTGELAEEMCPCCGGMPCTEPGADDEGEGDAQMHGAEGRPNSVNSLVQLQHNNFDHRDQLGPFGRSVTTTVQVRPGPSEWGIESRTNTTASVVVGDPPTHRRLPRPDRGDRYRGL